MKPFVFRLEKVLGLRRSHRDRAREELAEAINVMQILEGQKNDLEETFAKQRMTRTAEAQSNQPRVDILLDGRKHELLTIAQQKQLDEKIQMVAEELENRRSKLVEADREVKVLERLRERDKENHHRDKLRFESKEMDEISQLVYRRQHEETT